MPSPTVSLTGWGRIAPTRAELAEPATVAGAARLLETSARGRGLIARGLGRSYNNAAQCDGGVVISTARLNRILDLDPATGLASCEAASAWSSSWWRACRPAGSCRCPRVPGR